MTMSCAFSQASLPAHHNAMSAGDSPLDGFLLDRLRLNSEGVMIRLRIALAILAPPRFRLETSCRLLDDGAEREQRLLLERPPDQLQPERQALRVETARHGNARQPGHVYRHREHIVEIHLDRIGAALFADAERGGRRRRRQDSVDAVGETALEIA